MQYRFADFVLDTDLFRLFFRGETVALRPQGLDALALLLEERHRVVTKEELLARVWKGSSVSENSLSQCMREVRRALGEDGQRTGSIRTVHGRGFRFVGEALVVRAPGQARPDYATPSSFAVAVAPFEGSTGDPADAELGRWVSVELVRRLARHGSLPVLSEAANEGGVVARYVVAGSVQREGARARLHLRLIDARDGTAVWADRIDLRDSDLLGLPDGLAAAAFGAIEPELVRRVAHETADLPDDLESSLLMVRGIEHFFRRTPHDNRRAISYLTRAARITRSVAASHYLGLAHYNDIYYQWHDDFRSTLGHASAAAERSMEVAPKEPFGPILTSLLHLFSGRSNLALYWAELAVEIDPNLSEARGLLGRVHAVRGMGEASIHETETAMRLNPNDPRPGDLVSALAMGHFVAGRYDEAAHHAERAARLAPYLMSNYLSIAASRALLGDELGAANAAADLRRVSRFSAEPLRYLLSTSPKDLTDRFFGGLSRAGIDVR